MKTKKVKISGLKPHPKNPNAHPAGQITELRSSLEQFDQVKNIITWQGYIIAGHGLVAAAEKQGIEYLKAHDVSDWPEEKAIKLMIADNRLAEMANINDEILTNLLKDFDNPLDIPGIDEKLLDDLKINLNLDEGGLTDPDEIPEDVEPICKTGDLYLLGNHRLLCGNATKREDVERLMNDKKADMVFTDPPYGINIVRNIKTAIGGAKSFGRVRQRGGKPSGVVGGKDLVEPRLYMPVVGDDKPFDPTFLLNMASVVILWGANHYSSRLPDMAGWIVWDKGVSSESTFSACELAWTNVGGHIKRYEHRWSGMVRGGNRKDELKDRVHPTQKPVGLFVQIMTDYKKEKTILDLFLGSGTTLIAAEKTNRICYGMEIDEHYCDVILQRWANYTGKDSVREDGASFKELIQNRR